MNRQFRHLPSRAASIVAAALVSSIVGIAIPATVTGMFQSRGLPWTAAAAAPALVASTGHAADATHDD
ncbi:MAG TPA: hypothetical protein VII68_18670 [Casimicrobiaceae bacterium]|jgi:hypothetical protein